MGTHSNTVEAHRVNLSYQDVKFKDQLLDNLNKLRRQKELCDGTVMVGAHEYPVHLAVLASASPYLFDVFKKSSGERGYKLAVKDHESFEILLDYAYTGRLEVPEDNVKAVYRVANHLKMANAVQACSGFLAERISCDNCLGIRQYAVDESLRETTDRFIQTNINDIIQSKKFFGLPQIPVEIVGADTDLIESSNDKHMFELVLNWAKGILDPDKPRLDDLTQQTNVLNLNTDSSLTDFAHISDEKVKEEDGIVQDYKKTKKKLQPPKTKETINQLSPVGNVRKFSLSPAEPVSPKEWAIIASYQLKDKSYAALALLNNTLVTISIHYRPSTASNGNGTVTTTERSASPEAEVSPQSKFFEHEASLTPLAVMGDSRCGFGIEVVDGKLFVCGGYDRSECLITAEIFDIHKNQWERVAEMSVPRGRFSVTAVNSQVYAVGGSNGFNEQKILEVYDIQHNKWFSKGEVPTAKVSQGMTTLNGKIYCVGGCLGQQSVKDCQVYDTETNTWNSIAPLQTGGCLGQQSVKDCQVYDTETNTWNSIAPLQTARYQAAVCAHNGMIYAMGGTDAWVCLSSVEVYDPVTNTWSEGPELNVARRGAGCDVFNGTIYLAGGSDGQHSLKTIEILDAERGWILGPSMSIPRANVGVINCGNRLFAVGGFTGKKFLDTMEFLTTKPNASWCCYLPVEDSVVAHKVLKRNSSDGSYGCEKLDANSNINSDQSDTSLQSTSSMTNGH
ncbi:hypothetical protein FSP39_008509 [Pinctada imbricata]|uniref:BTB domain-containing protein n=1 Tax=Pinctada imbricata TaxID=66713 RepID=A0AA88XKS8_PINIB|nr:hypothetical protein FSP39_008509 [Pinctada imbricata]